MRQFWDKYKALGCYVALFLAVILLMIHYLGKTPFSIRTYDVVGHISYIKSIAIEHRMPRPDIGWGSHHPPLYFVLAAGIYLFADARHWDVLYCVQVLSVFFTLVFSFYGVLVIRRLFVGSKVVWLPIIMFVFWPSIILHSVRIGNDSLWYALAAAMIYHLLMFYQQPHWQNTKEIFLASLFCALAIQTKANGLVLAVILVAMVFFKITQTHSFQQILREPLHVWKRIRVVVLIMTVLIGASTFGYVYRNYKYSDHGAKDWMIYNSNLPEGLKVANHPSNFIYFDIKTFATVPYANPWVDLNEQSGGRQYFWNYFLKTSLFGEWNAPGDVDFIYPVKENLFNTALAVSISALFVFGAVLYYLLTLDRKTIKDDAFILVASALIVASTIYLRVTRPYSCSGDFRYALPLLIFITTMYARVFEKVLQCRFIMLKALMSIATILFIGGSILFIKLI